MNGRVAKKLRRKAEDSTVGRFNKEYERREVSRNINGYGDTAVFLVKGTTRSVYQGLKEDYRSGELAAWW